jgi:serine/threonine protein phosphatase 1
MANGELSTMNFFVVGDIHGCSAQLKVLLAHHEFYQDRRIVFLGDFVDVGPDSPGVLDLLLRVRSEHGDAVFLQGNHDAGLLSYLSSGDFAAYAAAGGIPTIQAYCGAVSGDVRASLERELPSAHKTFLANLEPYFETEDYLFSHSGYSPESPGDRSQETMVLRSHQKLFENGAPLGKLAVCGHYFQRTRTPFVTDRVICLDTGCGILGGPLSAILLPEMRIVQVARDLRIYG